MDLFDNPMVQSAKRAMTQEQLDEYKRIGEYMYNNKNYVEVETAKKSPPTTQELAMYAYEFIKAGGDPKDISDEELNALFQIKGKEWYKDFGFDKEDVPTPLIELQTEKDLKKFLETKEGIERVEAQLKNTKLSRTERRAIERKLEKQKKKLN
jgi:hypothetical protein